MRPYNFIWSRFTLNQAKLNQVLLKVQLYDLDYSNQAKLNPVPIKDVEIPFKICARLKEHPDPLILIYGIWGDPNLLVSVFLFHIYAIQSSTP